MDVKTSKSIVIKPSQLLFPPWSEHINKLKKHITHNYNLLTQIKLTIIVFWVKKKVSVVIRVSNQNSVKYLKYLYGRIL